tara:strand:+ start:57 stop:158 length:102 start_codon:yes stop_codon:yes gene_type:complete
VVEVEEIITEGEVEPVVSENLQEQLQVVIQLVH